MHTNVTPLSPKQEKQYQKNLKTCQIIQGQRFLLSRPRDMNIGNQFQNGNIVHSLQYLSNFKLC